MKNCAYKGLGIKLCKEAIKLETGVGICYHQTCSFLYKMDPGWTVEGQATKEVEPRLPRLPNGWLSRQSRQSSLDAVLAQDNNGGDLDLLPT